MEQSETRSRCNLTPCPRRPKFIDMKAFKTTLALLVLALTPVLAASDKVIDKDGCVTGQPCKCKDCGYICGSDACKASAACKGDACSKS